MQGEKEAQMTVILFFNQSHPVSSIQLQPYIYSLLSEYFPASIHSAIQLKSADGPEGIILILCA